MTGRREVARLKARLVATFARVATLPADAEVRADFARYLCVLVSGYLERAVRELAAECARRQASPRVARYVADQMDHFQNPNAKKLVDLVQSFDSAWADQFTAFIDGRRKDAIDSVVANRHLIAHGDVVGITYVRIKDYFDAIAEVIDFLANLLDPP